MGVVNGEEVCLRGMGIVNFAKLDGERWAESQLKKKHRIRCIASAG